MLRRASQSNGSGAIDLALWRAAAIRRRRGGRVGLSRPVVGGYFRVGPSALENAVLLSKAFLYHPSRCGGFGVAGVGRSLGLNEQDMGFLGGDGRCSTPVGTTNISPGPIAMILSRSWMSTRPLSTKRNRPYHHACAIQIRP